MTLHNTTITGNESGLRPSLFSLFHIYRYYLLSRQCHSLPGLLVHKSSCGRDGVLSRAREHQTYFILRFISQIERQVGVRSRPFSFFIHYAYNILGNGRQLCLQNLFGAYHMDTTLEHTHHFTRNDYSVGTDDK